MNGLVRVAVLMGGPSEEHEISLKSGHGVTDALRHRGWAAQPVVIPKTASVKEACAFVERVLRQSRADVAFLALHGTFGEDGTIQQLCESLSVAYTGSDARASRLGMDKVASRKRFEASGLAVPPWHVVERARHSPASVSRWLRQHQWPYPMVVKPTDQGSSIGVSVVRAEQDLPDALKAAGRYSAQMLIEQFVQGREVTVGILGAMPLPVVEIRPHQPFFDFTAKYTVGMTDYLVPAPLEPDLAARVQAAGLAAHRALGCRHLSRTDLILTRDGVPVVLEVNTIPGFTPTSLLPKAAAYIQISYDEICEQLIAMALQDHPQAARETAHV